MKGVLAQVLQQQHAGRQALQEGRVLLQLSLHLGPGEFFFLRIFTLKKKTEKSGSGYFILTAGVSASYVRFQRFSGFSSHIFLGPHLVPLAVMHMQHHAQLVQVVGSA